MNRIGKAPGRWTLGVAVICCAAGIAHTQSADLYEGRGFFQDLELSGPVRKVAIGDFQQSPDGHKDLVLWKSNNTVTVYNRFSEYDDAPQAIGTAQAFAVTRYQQDRMWRFDGTDVWQIEFSGDSFTDKPVDFEVEDFNVDGGTGVFKTQELRGDSLFLVIDSSIGRARVRKLTGVSPAGEAQSTLLFSKLVDEEEEGHYHDIAVLDWNGDLTNDYALLTDNGIRIFTSPTATPIDIACDPNDAFLEVLPKEGTYPRDLLIAQYRVAPGQQLDLHIRNSAHDELLPNVGPLGLNRVYFADFTTDPRREMIMPLATTRLVGVMAQDDITNPVPDLFTVSSTQPNMVDLLTCEEPNPCLSLSNPELAVGDLDGDGDEDLVFVDDRGYCLAVTSDNINVRIYQVTAFAEYAVPPGSPPRFTVDVDLTTPAGGTVEVELWRRDDPDPEVASAEYLGTQSISSSGGSLTFPLSQTPEGDEIYNVLYRVTQSGVERQPVIHVWTQGNQTIIEGEQEELFPWFNFEIGTDEEGIVKRPKMGPGGGTGPH